MIKKTTLFVPADLNGYMLLLSIDVALWLHKIDDYKLVTIKCISNYNIFNLFSLLLRLKNFFSYLTLIKFKKLTKFLNFKLKKEKISELASFATGKIDHSRLVIDDLEIKLIRLKSKNQFSIVNFLNLSYRIITDYLNYFSKSALNSKAYLEYQVNGVYAGLHVLSEALRSDYRSYGSIFYCRIGILTALYKLHSCIKLYKNISLSKESVSFMCGIDSEYIYGFFARFMCDRGVIHIETNNMQKPYIKRYFKEKYYSRLNIFNLDNDSLVIDKKKISQYYKERIDKPWKVFKQKKENYSSNKELTNLKGTTVILYLHSFTDAQYVYGYDGYHDLMDWCLNTISILNSNEYIKKVIVKTHPDSSSIYHPGDTISNKYLKSKISGFSKVQWADFHFDVNHITSTDLVIGITHHGRVAEELVFNKIPVIASSFGPWGKEYKFGYFWKDVSEYKMLISGNLITKLEVTKTQTDELNRYAMHLYFNKYSSVYFNNYSTFIDMLEIYRVNYENNDFSENMDQIIYLISQIDDEEKLFKKYITTRLQRINLLIDRSKTNDIKNK